MFLLKHFRKELVLQQDFHAAAFTIIRRYARLLKHGPFFSVGSEGDISRYVFAVDNINIIFHACIFKRIRASNSDMQESSLRHRSPM